MMQLIDTPMKPTIRSMLLFGAIFLASAIVSTPARAFYDPSAQRWINRDPIGERAGANVHCFLQNGPTLWLDRFGKAAASRPGPGKPGHITPLPPLPTPLDNCSPEKKEDIQKARKAACDRITKCTNPACDQAQLKGLRELCDSSYKPIYRCARSDDSECNTPTWNGQTPCAYQKGRTITFCGDAFPADGSKCPGVGGPINLECLIIHEMTHEVIEDALNGKGSQDDANKMQKCMGCPTGAPHQKPK